MLSIQPSTDVLLLGWVYILWNSSVELFNAVALLVLAVVASVSIAFNSVNAVAFRPPLVLFTDIVCTMFDIILPNNFFSRISMLCNCSSSRNRLILLVD